VDGRLHGLTGSTLANVADDADNPNLGVADVNRLSDGAFSRPEAPGKRLVDDEHQRSAGAVRRLKATAGANRSAHRLEEVRADLMELNGRRAGLGSGKSEAIR